MAYLKEAYTHHFPGPNTLYEQVHVDAKWTQPAKTDAEIVIVVNGEELWHHAFSNTSQDFKYIIDYLGANPDQKLYGLRISVEPPEISKEEWTRNAAAGILRDRRQEFSFRRGSLDGYNTINATFYAFGRGAPYSTGSTVKIHMVTLADASLNPAREDLPSTRT